MYVATRCWSVTPSRTCRALNGSDSGGASRCYRSPVFVWVCPGQCRGPGGGSLLVRPRLPGPDRPCCHRPPARAGRCSACCCVAPHVRVLPPRRRWFRFRRRTPACFRRVARPGWLPPVPPRRPPTPRSRLGPGIPAKSGLPSEPLPAPKIPRCPGCFQTGSAFAGKTRGCRRTGGWRRHPPRCRNCGTGPARGGTRSTTQQKPQHRWWTRGRDRGDCPKL
mmetsp:Transcript_16884/g.46377  ORF Transcript_16884/g.46377 Transcript_16884/m.46377 type:complete len:221 (-) Transcript_16884:711-1373(-)